MEPELDAVRLSAWRALLHAHATVVEAAEQALAAASLPPLTWYDVLSPLARAPGRRLRMRDLAREVTISRSGLVRLVDRMEDAGLLARERVPGDRRGVAVTLTAEGSAMLDRMWPVYGGVVAARFGQALSDREGKVLADALARVATTPSA